MLFAWDETKSAKLKEERGASFEELREEILEGGLLGSEENPSKEGQFLLIVRLESEVWAVVAERRGERIRLVTAYPSRKWRKKYES